MSVQPVNNATLNPVKSAGGGNSKPLVSFKANEKPDTVEISGKETEPKKKNIGKYIALGLGAVAAVGLAVYGIIRCRNKNVKKFFDKDNKLIKGVKLEKGKAINSDGSMFSGVMKTMNKKGEECALEYANGNIIKSIKNGELFKTYNYKYAENGTILSKEILDSSGDSIATHFFDNNGKIRQIYRESTAKRPFQTCYEFSNGKKVAEYDDYGREGKIFDENGKVIKEMVYDEDIHGDDVIYYNSDGEITKKYIDVYHPKRADIRNGESITNDKYRPRKLTYYSKGEPTKTIRIKKDDCIGCSCHELRIDEGKTDKGSAKNTYSIILKGEKYEDGLLRPSDAELRMVQCDDSGHYVKQLTEWVDLDDLDMYYKKYRPDLVNDPNNLSKKERLCFNQENWNTYKPKIKEALQLAKQEGLPIGFDVNEILKFLEDFKLLS